MDNKNTNNQTEQTDKNKDDFKEGIKQQGKKIENTLKQFAKDTGTFLLVLFIIICMVLYGFISGGLAVYLSKLGGANILPTNREFFPYTNVKPSIIPSNTHIFTKSNINFPHDSYNTSNYLLNGTRKYKETLQSSFYLIYILMTYFITIYENMVQFNYAAINFGLYVMNKIPSDTAILLFGPTILTMLTFLISFINPIYFIFTWFASLQTFFEFDKNAEQLKRNADFTGVWKWFNGFLNMFLVPISIIFALWMACIMFFIFFFSTWVTFFVASIILWLVMWSCYFYAATINGVNVTIISTILGLFKFYKFSLMTLISFVIILLAFLNFGIWGMVNCLGILVLICLGAFTALGLDMFSPIR